MEMYIITHCSNELVCNLWRKMLQARSYWGGLQVLYDACNALVSETLDGCALHRSGSLSPSRSISMGIRLRWLRGVPFNRLRAAASAIRGGCRKLLNVHVCGASRFVSSAADGTSWGGIVLSLFECTSTAPTSSARYRSRNIGSTR